MGGGGCCSSTWSIDHLSLKWGTNSNHCPQSGVLVGQWVAKRKHPVTYRGPTEARVGWGGGTLQPGLGLEEVTSVALL